MHDDPLAAIRQQINNRPIDPCQDIPDFVRYADPLAHTDADPIFKHPSNAVDTPDNFRHRSFGRLWFFVVVIAVIAFFIWLSNQPNPPYGP